MARYPIAEARRHVIQAIRKLNSKRGLELGLISLEYTDLLGWNFIKVHLYEGNTNEKFDSMLNEFIFTRDDAMTKLDTAAGILGKNLTEEQIILLRVAYIILRDLESN